MCADQAGALGVAAGEQSAARGRPLPGSVKKGQSLLDAAEEQAGAELSRLIEALQDADTTRALAAATTPAELCAALRAKWGES